MELEEAIDICKNKICDDVIRNLLFNRKCLL